MRNKIRKFLSLCIALNLMIPSMVLFTVNITYATDEFTWTEQTTAGARNWRFIASSGDGSILGAVVNGGYIYTSTDSGATWDEHIDAGFRNWYSIASSNDGVNMAVASYSGSYIHTSSDSGATWTSRVTSGNRNWHAITSSDDGAKLAAAAFGGQIYTSTDSGATWSTQSNASGSKSWKTITSSSDGTKLAAALNGYIYTSSDSGATWTEQTNAGSRSWYSITSSSDGTKLAAVVNNGYIYTSSDSGATWTEQTNSGQRYWYSITSSSDGTKLAATVQNGYIYTSNDSGATWTAQTDAGSRSWVSIASSDDGIRLAAVVEGGYIYTGISDTTPPTVSNITSDKADGAYTVGEIIDIDVTFSEAVTSTGNVTVTLETGTTDRTCTFTVTSATTGTCNYTVQAGDTSSDLTVSSISGTIADGAANTMVNFVPTTNLAANKAIVIDTTGPVISDIRFVIKHPPGADISWTTDEDATSYIEYGLTDAYGSNTTLDEDLDSTHSQTITGLSQVTTYHYRITSEDALGNSTTTEDDVFTTSGATPGTKAVEQPRVEEKIPPKEPENKTEEETVVTQEQKTDAPGENLPEVLREGIDLIADISEKVCTVAPYVKNPIRLYRNNNPADIKLLEQFLNKYENANLSVDGYYSREDFRAVIKWQEKHAKDILTPWGLTK